MQYSSDKQLAARFGVTRPTIWGWVKADPSFPKPIKLSAGCTRWKGDEIDAWEAARAAKREKTEMPANMGKAQ